MIFSDAYASYGHLVQNDAIVALIGRVDLSRGDMNLLCDELIAIDDIDQHLAARLELDLIDEPGPEPIQHTMQQVHQALLGAKVTNGGRAIDVLLHVHSGDRRVALRPSRLKVAPDPDMLEILRQLLGSTRVRLVERPRRQNGGARVPLLGG